MDNAPVSQSLLDDSALDALRRTRPWLYLLGIISSIMAAISVIMLAAGVIGLHINAGKSSEILAAAAVGLLISLPTAITQLRYAVALSRIESLKVSALSDAVDLACTRQRHVWIVNAFTVLILIAGTLLQLLLHMPVLR